MTTRDIIRGIKQDLADEFFNGKCEVTDKTSHKMGMVFHHINYKYDYDRRRFFEKGAKGDLAYFNQLRWRVDHNPEDFAYVTSPVHQLITKIEAYKNFNLSEFVRILESRRV